MNTGLEYPLRLGSPRDFGRVSAFLHTPAFSDSVVQRILRSSGYLALGTESNDDARVGQTVSLSVFIRLFVELDAIPRADVEREIERATLDSFLSLDLLRLDNSHYRSPVFVYPVGNLLIASDYYNQSSGPDSVFPAIQAGTLRLLSLLPESDAKNGLDLCSGTGVCGFAMSPRVKQVVACDITERATHFAQFNCLLNNCRNVEIANGDLYDAVAGRSFDRIVAHPPYAPSADAVEAWRDGGPIGEVVTKRIIEGLPDHLNADGEFFAVCLGSDRQEMPFEQRVRDWLGEKKYEFDIIWAVQQDFSPSELARRTAARKQPEEESDRTASLEKTFRELGVSNSSFGCLGIKRQGAETRSASTFRTRLSSKSDHGSFETAFERNRQCSHVAFRIIWHRVVNVIWHTGPSRLKSITVSFSQSIIGYGSHFLNSNRRMTRSPKSMALRMCGSPTRRRSS